MRRGSKGRDRCPYASYTTNILSFKEGGSGRCRTRVIIHLWGKRGRGGVNIRTKRDEPTAKTAAHRHKRERTNWLWFGKAEKPTMRNISEGRMILVGELIAIFDE